MNIQPNAIDYELNKLYRQEQEARCEKQRRAAQAKSEKKTPSILVLLLSVFK